MPFFLNESKIQTEELQSLSIEQHGTLNTDIKFYFQRFTTAAARFDYAYKNF